MDDKTTALLAFFMVCGFFTVLLFVAAWLDDREAREADRERDEWFNTYFTTQAAEQAHKAPYKIEQELDEAYDPRKSFGRN